MATTQTTLTEQCLRNLSLTGQPFSDEKPDQYFEHQQLSTQLAVAEQLIRSGGAPVLVAGADGFGKSSLLRKITFHLQQSGYHPVLIHAAPESTADDLIQRLLSAYGAPPSRPGHDAISHAISQLESLASSGRTPILLIDDAQLLNMNALKMLASLKSTLNEKSQSNIGLLLSVDTGKSGEIPSAIAQFFPENSVHKLQLKAFSQDQSLAYLRSRLEIAGRPKEAKPAIRGFKKIFLASEGIPSELNVLAAKELEKNYGDSGNSSRPKALVGILLLLCAAVAGAYWYQLHENTTAPTAEDAEPGQDISALAAELKASWAENNTAPELAITQSDPAQSAAEETLDEVAAEIAAMPGTDSSIENDELEMNSEELAEEAAIPLKAVSSTVAGADTETAAAMEVMAENVGIENQTEEVAAVTATEAPIAEQPVVENIPSAMIQIDEPTTQIQRNIPIEAAAATAVTAESSASTEEVTASADDAAPEPPAAIKVEEIAPPPVAVAATPASNPTPVKRPVIVAENLDWVQSAPSSHYTLQLVGSSNLEKIEKFVSVVSQNIDTAVYTTQRNNRPWYVVVGGDFDSSAAAKKAVGTLPSWVQQNKPWPRRIADIRKSISE